MQFVPTPETSVMPLEPGMAFIDPEGDLNVVINDETIVCFQREGGPFIRYCSLSAFQVGGEERSDVVRVLAPGEEVILKV